jgi:hypothetical protein
MLPTRPRGTVPVHVNPIPTREHAMGRGDALQPTATISRGSVTDSLKLNPAAADLVFVTATGAVKGCATVADGMRAIVKRASRGVVPPLAMLTTASANPARTPKSRSRILESCPCRRAATRKARR